MKKHLFLSLPHHSNSSPAKGRCPKGGGVSPFTFFVVLAVSLLAGCNHETKTEAEGQMPEFETTTFSGERCLVVTGGWLLDASEVRNSYSVVWPAEGLLSPAAMRELMYLYFADSTSANFEEASDRWLDDVEYLVGDDGDCRVQKVESIDTTDEGGYTYFHLESSCTTDSALAVFLVRTSTYNEGAAHGLYSCDYLTVDRETGNVVHLADLVTDTNLLCEAIAHAIQDLEVNKETRECLFDEFRNADRMPMPGGFFVDSARNGINVLYGLYHITPYACGIQTVTLPIFWLSKHVSLTPYAKRLFGSGSYID